MRRVKYCSWHPLWMSRPSGRRRQSPSLKHQTGEFPISSTLHNKGAALQPDVSRGLKKPKSSTEKTRKLVSQTNKHSSLVIQMSLPEKGPSAGHLLFFVVFSRSNSF
jgi:hypothetical protein